MSVKKLAGQTAVYGISSIVARLLNYLLTPYLTRIMSEQEYGVITDMYALIPFALVVLTLGLESGYFRFAGRTGVRAEKNRIFSSSWGAVLCMATVFFALVVVFRTPIANATGYADHMSYIWMVAGIIFLDVASAIPFVRLREQGWAGMYVVVRVLSVAVNILLCVFFYSVLPRLSVHSCTFLSSDAFWGPGYVFLANLIASAVAFIMVLPVREKLLPKLDIKVITPLMLYSLPLLLSGIAGMANEYIDRQMIKYLMPGDVAIASVGIYGAVTKIGVILLLFTQMYRMGAEPYFLGSFRKDDFLRTNAEAMKYFIAVSIAIFLCIVLFTDLFALIIGRSFREGIYILPVVLVANILVGVVFNLSFWYKQSGKTKFAILITGTGLVFTVIMNLILVPLCGYYGAAIARLICEAVMVGLSYYLCIKFCPIPYDLRRIGEYVLAGVLIYSAGLLTRELPPFLKYLLNTGLLAGYIIYIIRREHIVLKGFLRRENKTC